MRTAWFFVLAAFSCGGSAPAPQQVSIAPLPPAPTAAPDARPRPPAPDAPGHIGETVTFDDCEWLIIEARDAGQTLASNSQFVTETKTTPGRFIEVHFKITSRSKREEMMFDRPKIRDAKGREFAPIDMESFYLPPRAKVIGLEILQPGLPKEFWTMIEVAPDAEKLELVVHGFVLHGPTRAVSLGL